jgi:restriction system protein
MAEALIVSFVVVVGTLAAGWLGWYLRRKSIANRRYRDLSRLRMLGPREFERHVAEFYRRSGFCVQLTKVTGDQGIDVLADGKGGRIGIQVKQYCNAVGNDAVQEVVAGLAFHRCSRGVVVTTSRFTPAAKALARAHDVELIDGATYVALVARPLGIRDAAQATSDVRLLETS